MSAYQTQAEQDLTTMSKRLQSSPNIMSHLNKFYELTQPNENTLKMIQQGTTVNAYRSEKKICSRDSPIESPRSSPRSMVISEQQNKKAYQIEKKIAFKEDFPFCILVFKIFVICFIVFFAVDFYFELQNERERKTHEVAKCYQDYVENNCSAPLEALVQECSKLEYCASRDPLKMTKVSDVFVNSMSGVFSKVASQLTYMGMGVIGILVLLYLCRPAMYHEERVSKFQ